jgi:D-alanyl-D-alanine carboxypeptidase
MSEDRGVQVGTTAAPCSTAAAVSRDGRIEPPREGWVPLVTGSFTSFAENTARALLALLFLLSAIISAPSWAAATEAPAPSPLLGADLTAAPPEPSEGDTITADPTAPLPTTEPTAVPTPDPTPSPTADPTATPTAAPTPVPDTTEPTVTVRTPAINAYGIGVGSNIVVSFSEPVIGASADNFVLRNSANTVSVASAVGYDSTTRTATMNPTANLAYGTGYIVSLTNIRDTAGNLLGDQSWRITTQYLITFASGSHTGFKFSSYATGNAVKASKAGTLASTSSAAAARRVYVDSRGWYFEIQNGTWAGYLIKETTRSYIGGKAGETVFATQRNMSMPVGRYKGITLNAAGTAIFASVSYNLAAAATARTSRWMVYNGQPYVLTVAGSWANRWVRTAGGDRSSSFTATRDNPLPACKVADVQTPYRAYSDVRRTFLDWTYMVPSTYKAPNLVPAGNAGVRYGYYGKVYVRDLLIADLRALNAAARAAGFGSLIINSAHRSYATQARWFASYTESRGYSNALLYSNRAGHSGHQLGTTLDINVYARVGLNAWMHKNAYKYGFIKSYPAGKTSVHCYGAEDWHFRYFGRTVAAQIKASGLTEREWLWYAKH